MFGGKASATKPDYELRPESKKKQIAYKVDHLQCLGLDASAKSVDSRNYHVLQLGLWRKNLSCFHL
jgi:hypothetical protein